MNVWEWEGQRNDILKFALPKDPTSSEVKRF